MTLRIALTLTISALAVQAVAQETPEAPPPLEPETLTVEETIAEGPYLFTVDSAWAGASNVFIVGAEDLSMKGNLSPGLQAQMVLSDDGSTLYTSSNYNERIVYGAMTSIIHEFDVATASITREIEVPPKLAMVEVQPGLLALTSDERYLLAQNAMPATSVTVVDLEAGEVLTEIPTPGCWIAIPAIEGHSFTTVCGDGTMATYSWEEDGTFGDPARSEVIFSPDDDALFTNPARAGDKLVFASFTGNFYVVDATGQTPVLDEMIPFTDGIEGDWVPTGSEVVTYNEPTDTLFVLMHGEGEEGSHKDPSTEIWAYDLTEREVLYRSNSNGETSILATQAEEPTLYASDGEVVYVYEVDPAARSAARLMTSHEGIGTAMMATNL